MLFNPTLKEVREFFYDAWHKALAFRDAPSSALALTELEKIAVYWMVQHPEYHVYLDAPKSQLEAAQFPAELGQSNPFLHLSMHLSIAEQISINQPPGIAACFEQLSTKLQSEHDAHHQIMEVLGQIMWEAQRHQKEPNALKYIELLEQLGRDA